MSVTGNRKVIRSAFKRLTLSKNDIIRNGMERFLDDAVDYALNAHDERHQHHIEFGDSYGWILFHNGEKVSMNINSGTESKSSVSAKLESLRDSMPKEGWIGVLMATMHPFKYYVVSYEMDILNKTIDWSKKGLMSYFRKGN